MLLAFYEFQLTLSTVVILPRHPAKPRNLDFGSVRQHADPCLHAGPKIRFDRHRVHGASGVKPRATRAFMGLPFSLLSRCLIKRRLEIHKPPQVQKRVKEAPLARGVWGVETLNPN